ncbi:hypothetical protein QYM36_009202, partial [Artemia franciscana]
DEVAELHTLISETNLSSTENKMKEVDLNRERKISEVREALKKLQLQKEKLESPQTFSLSSQPVKRNLQKMPNQRDIAKSLYRDGTSSEDINEYDRTEDWPLDSAEDTSRDMAEYIFWTGDEISVTQAIKDFIKQGMLSPNEAISFLEDVRNHLKRMQIRYGVLDNGGSNDIDAIQISKQFIMPIFKALEEIETDGDSVTLSKARSLLNNILSLDYIVTLIVMDFFLGYTLNLSKLLQSENIDMVMCIQCIDSVTEIFKEIRNSAEGRFHQLFLEATRLCRELEVTLVMPRKRKLFKIPSDIPAEKHIEFYYRVSIFLLFVDHLMQSLESRFTKHKVTLKGLSGILPSFFVKQPSSNLKEQIKLYASRSNEFRLRCGG